MQCDSIDESDTNKDGGADEAADDYEPLTKVGRGSGRTQVLLEPDLCLGHPGVNETNIGDVQPRAELWAAARLARVRNPVIRFTDGPGLVATFEVRAPGGPFIIALGAGPRRAGDLVTQLASKSGAPVSIGRRSQMAEQLENGKVRGSFCKAMKIAYFSSRARKGS